MTRVKRIRVRAIDFHRNGISGAPFHVAIFDVDKAAHPGDQGRKVGIVFEKPGHCAVLDVAKLAAGDIRFGSNSWRGDEYEPHLRKAIKKLSKSEA
jgi:hypothetical protein